MYVYLPIVQNYDSKTKIMMLKKFFAQKEKFHDFQELSEEDYIKVDGLVKDFLSKNKNFSHYIKNNIHVVMPFVLDQDKELTYDEKVLAFILAVDRDLNALRIYEEESMMPNIQKRCLEKLRFYNPTFIQFEKSFYKKFRSQDKLGNSEELKIAREELTTALSFIKNIKEYRVKKYCMVHTPENSVKSLKEQLLDNPQDLKEYELRLKKRKKEKKVLPSTHYSTDFMNKVDKKFIK